MFVNINDIKNGMTVIMDGKLCQVQEFQHVKPGKGAAIVKVKLRNLKTGAITVESYNSTIKVEASKDAKVQFVLDGVRSNVSKIVVTIREINSINRSRIVVI